ncbi:MAG: membrane protease YdiL (CAAX protease family) [Flavobacteriales bacterium]|jgi:membrane protease YdiL (CAAX protease family)
MLAIVINFSSIELIYNTSSNIGGVLFWLLAFLPLALMEEIIFRGYAFTKIESNFGI